jgi:4-amino-4-deoxy-L-arabinose transferase-like glycosyltransferase
MVLSKIRPYLPYLLGGLYACLYVFFWPKTFSIMDESAYLNHAYALKLGHLYPDQVGINTTMSYQVQWQGVAHIIPQYPPGMALLLMLFSFLGWQVALGMNLFFHLASYVLLIQILKKLALSPWWAALYLLHPTAIIFSRTVMSDIPTGTLILLSLWLFLQKRYVILSLVMGIALVVRTANGILLPIFCFAYLWEKALLWREEKAELFSLKHLKEVLPSLLSLIATTVIFLIAAYWYQKVIQEEGWAKYSQAAQISPRFFPKQSVFYGVSLLLLYPGMLIAPFVYRGAAYRPLLCLIIPILLLYMCCNFNDVGGNIIETFIVGQRYLISLMPLFVIAYAGMWKKIGVDPSHKPYNYLLIGGILALFTAGIFIHQRHDKKLREDVQNRASLMQVLPSDAHLIGNIHIVKLLHPAWTGVRSWTMITTQEMSMPDLKARALQQVEDSLAKNKSTYVAIVTRDYRSETSNENQIFLAIQDAFVTETYETGSGLQVRRILSKKRVVE